MNTSSALSPLIAGFLVSISPLVASAQTATIIATYYRDGHLVLTDSNAKFEVVSNSSGNPNLGNTVQVIQWSDGTVTNISRINSDIYMGGHPANSYGVGHIGGRIYESYCTENTVQEIVCYQFK